MKLFSTNNTLQDYSLKEAVFRGLPEDNGLFMPERIDELPREFIEGLKSKSLQEIGFEVAKRFVDGEIPKRGFWLFGFLGGFGHGGRLPDLGPDGHSFFVVGPGTWTLGLM